MKLKPFDIVKLKKHKFFLINHIVEKREEGKITKKLFAKGYHLKEENLSILQKIEIKKLINEFTENDLIELNIEEEIEFIVSNKTKKEWRLTKKVPII